ncbi:MAG: MFS transporter [Desulfobacteraceae bacterium]|nr:MAG: MFS transporter [Desulfobacteraceae bacterium]
MKKKLFYGWWIVFATNVICMFGYGTWLYSFGVFFKPMSEEFGWTRAMTSGAYALRSVEGGIASPIVGWAVDKYGARLLILIGAVISGAAFVLMPLIQSLLGFYLIYGLLLSAGMSAMLYLPAWTVIAKWFRRRLSFALAILSAGAGFGGLICAPLAAVLIERFGWRSAFVVMGVLIWCVVIPMALLVREKPEDMGLLPDGDVPMELPKSNASTSDVVSVQAAPFNGTPDYTLKEALRSSPFWFLALSFFFQGMAHSTVTVHTVPALTDAGVPAATASVSIGLLTLISIIGRLAFGTLGDHITKRYLFMVSYTMMGAGLLVLMTAKSMSMVWVFLFLFGIGFGGNIPLMPAIRAEYFGRKALGKIQGFMNPVMMIAGATGPIFAGHIFDTTGSYRIAFLATALMTFLAAVTIFFARPGRRMADAYSHLAQPAGDSVGNHPAAK